MVITGAIVVVVTGAIVVVVVGATVVVVVLDVEASAENVTGASALSSVV